MHDRILIIDDNPAIHADFKKILDGEQGTSVDEAATMFLGSAAPVQRQSQRKFELGFALQGMAGVEMVREALNRNAPYALAFVDMRMPPGCDGLATIEALWEVSPDLQVVICSAYSDHSWSDIQDRLGVTDQLLILKKPFDSSEVSQIAVAMAEKWRLTREMRKSELERAKRLQDAEETVVKNSRHLEMATSLAGLGYCSFDFSNERFSASGRTFEILGVAPNTIQTPAEFFKTLHEFERPRVQKLLDAAVQGNAEMECKTIVVRPDSEERHIQVRVTSEPVRSRSASSLFCVIQDVTESERALSAVRYASTHDSLTSLPNRVEFNSQLASALKHRKRTDAATGLVLLDADRFKSVNDTYGHPTGDAFLKEVAARLQKTIREVDTVARLGGDEFAIVQVGPKEPKDTISMLNRIFEEFRKPFELDGQTIFASLSAGIALAPENGDDAESLMKAADLALYRAKQDGRGTYRFFDREMDKSMQARRIIEKELLPALEHDQYRVFYQPIVESETERIVGMEALIRWMHPERGQVPPCDFVEIAEDTGLIVQIGHWVLHQACKDAATWPDHVSVSVNVSAVQFKKGDLFGSVSQALEKSGLRPERLELEITETVLLNATQETINRLHSLRDLGVRIAMDDFGIGHSSLSYLQSFPFDKLKLDRSFLLESDRKLESKAIIKAVAGLGSALEMYTCAEGVETREHFERVRDAGYSHVQGYLFGKPASNADMASKHFASSSVVNPITTTALPNAGNQTPLN